MLNQTIHTHQSISGSQQITAQAPKHLAQMDSFNEATQSGFVLEVGQPVFPEIFEDDHTSMHQRLGQFLKTNNANDTLKYFPNQPLPDVLFMDEEEFNQQMSEYETRKNPDQTRQIPEFNV